MMDHIKGQNKRQWLGQSKRWNNQSIIVWHYNYSRREEILKQWSHSKFWKWNELEWIYSIRLMDGKCQWKHSANLNSGTRYWERILMDNSMISLHIYGWAFAAPKGHGSQHMLWPGVAVSNTHNYNDVNAWTLIVLFVMPSRPMKSWCVNVCCWSLYCPERPYCLTVACWVIPRMNIQSLESQGRHASTLNSANSVRIQHLKIHSIHMASWSSLDIFKMRSGVYIYKTSILWMSDDGCGVLRWVYGQHVSARKSIC